MKTFYTFILFFLSFTVLAQNEISGTVLDEKNKPIAGANIFIEGFYDGTASDENGDFSFETSAQNNQVLIVSFLIYETLKELRF